MSPSETRLWTNGTSVSPHTVSCRDFGRLLDWNFL